ncbi:MAG: carbohydrate-binding protein [Vicinamibacterales bacterium]
MRRVAILVWSLFVVFLSAARADAGEEVVVYASDASAVQGSWVSTADGSAAGGRKLSSPDRGLAATTTAQAAPRDYFEASVPVDANTPYHVWLRLRAGGDSKWNDSAWVQFDAAIDGAGAPLYRIGTTSGLLLNLEPCNACGTAGWGWVDGAYWLAQTSTVRFSSGGTHTIRVQVREDGVEVDQIVLSPSAWLSSAPGQARGDSTIVPRSQASGAAAYSGYPVTLPGTIQAEAFDTGGSGVGYRDNSPGNSGGQFRNTDVDIEPSSGGGYNVGWMSAGEWLRYSIDLPAGSYAAEFRVACFGQGGTFHVELDGADVTGAMRIPDTGGWQSWQTLTRAISVSSRVSTARLVVDSEGTTAGGNIDWIRVSPGGGASGQASPYTGSPVPIPGSIEAEQFDNGGEAVGYHDTTSGNSGGVFRSADVDVEPAAGGGYNVGWIEAGEWLQYTADISDAGAYTAEFRVASLGRGGSVHLEIDGTNVSGGLSIPDTGGWQNWQTVSASVQLPAGRHAVRVVADSRGVNAVGNIDRVRFAAGGGAPPPGPSSNVITVTPGQDLQGAIDAARPGDTIVLTPGAVYEGGLILRAKSGNEYITIRSAAPDSTLPGPTQRITPQDAPQLPKIQGGTAGLPAIMTELGAHHWRLQFLELVDTWPYGDILALGDGSNAQRSLGTVAHDLVVDRVYVHGVSGQQQKRGIALNSASTTIVNCYISDIRLANGDSQAIAGWNGPGPFTIENNYLEATGENFLLGGSDPPIPNLVPSDIVFRGNTVTKQPSWRSQGYAVKNLIELKNAQRVTIEGNVIEYNWSGGQSGHAIVLTPRNQDGGAPWSVVQQIAITNNVIRHVAGVLNVLGTDYRFTSLPLRDVTFRNNLVVDLSKANWGGAGQLLLTSGGTNLTVDHNTVFTDGTSVVYADGPQVQGFVFSNNIVPDNAWAVMGSAVSEGNGTLSAFFPGAVFQRNVIAGGQSWLYPSGNYFPVSMSEVGFLNPSGNYRLGPSSPYRSSATDGGPLGADIDAIGAATGTDY